jgi:AcrR family transcriptional regulator
LATRIPEATTPVKRTPQIADFRRRTPRQTRAKDTVDVIIEATAQILQREGRSTLNTNRIAERAGISIGTLYQYFPNKQAILIEIARREIERDRAVVARAISQASENSGVDPARIGVRALITSQKKQSKVRRAAFDALLAEGFSQFGLESASAFQQINEMIGTHRERLLSDRARYPSPLMLFVISRAITGAIRSAILEDSPFLTTSEFEDELVHLIRGFFRKGKDRDK